MYAAYCRLHVPVWASTREVIRAARTKLAPAGKARAQREARRQYLLAMLAQHADAADRYRQVTKG